MYFILFFLSQKPAVESGVSTYIFAHGLGLNGSGNEGADDSSSSDEEQDRFDGSHGMAASIPSKWGVDEMDVLEKMALLLSESGPVSRTTICSQFKRRFGFDPSVGLNVEGKKKNKKVADVLVNAGICAIEKRANVNGKKKKKFVVPMAYGFNHGKGSSGPAMQLPREVLHRDALVAESMLTINAVNLLILLLSFSFQNPEVKPTEAVLSEWCRHRYH